MMRGTASDRPIPGIPIPPHGVTQSAEWRFDTTRGTPDRDNANEILRLDHEIVNMATRLFEQQALYGKILEVP